MVVQQKDASLFIKEWWKNQVKAVNANFLDPN
jgi:hypothetical protein